VNIDVQRRGRRRERDLRLRGVQLRHALREVLRPRAAVDPEEDHQRQRRRAREACEACEACEGEGRSMDVTLCVHGANLDRRRRSAADEVEK
jgi:hypothetical protein